MGREDAFIVSRVTFKKAKQNRLARNTHIQTQHSSLGLETAIDLSGCCRIIIRNNRAEKIWVSTLHSAERKRPRGLDWVRSN